MNNLTTAPQFLSRQQALDELAALKFAVSAMAQLIKPPGSFDRELATNAALKAYGEVIRQKDREIMEQRILAQKAKTAQ